MSKRAKTVALAILPPAVTRTSKARKTPFPHLPRDARHAASMGFDFAGASYEVEDDFVSGSKMLRRGTLTIGNQHAGGTLNVPFTAEFHFGKPVDAKVAGRNGE